MTKWTSKGPSKSESRRRRWKEWKEFLRDDCDWDFAFILRTIAYKLERTRKCILGNNIIKRAQEVHDEIEKVECLFKRVIEDKYLDELWKPFQKKYGTLRMRTVPKVVNGKKVYAAKFSFSKDNKRNRGAAFKAWRRCSKKSREAMVLDLRRAFRIMSDKIWGWWD